MIVALPLFYKANLLFMVQFHHMGLAALALLITCMGLVGFIFIASVRLSMFIQWAITKWQVEKHWGVKPVVGASGVVALLGIGLIHGFVVGEDGSGAPMGFMSLLKLDGLGAGPIVVFSLMMICAALLLFWAHRFNGRTIILMATALAILVAAPVMAYAVSSNHPPCVTRVNNAAGLANWGAKRIRQLGDLDGDGHSHWFGGRDCDDTNSKIHPGAQDIPQNGIDEDCSGEDTNLKQLKERLHIVEKPHPPLTKPVLPTDLSVLLITVDALRADAVGFMGQTRPVTPTLDKLFENGVIYENAYSLSAYTSQSIPAMLTGKYPCELHRTNVEKLRIGLDETFAAEHICSKNVACGAILSHFLFKPFYGWNQGFTHWEYTNGVPTDVLSSAKKYTSPDVTRGAIKWLSKPENTNGRFFLWVHYMDPHGDYLPHKGFKQFGKTRRDGYDHEVLYTDYHIGKFLEKFYEPHLDERTIVVLTADHGESFKEHGRWLHGYELYEENIRVPLAIAGPGIPKKRIGRPTSAIHMYATLLDLFDVKPQETSHSKSLLPDWVSGQQLHEPYVIADLDKNEKYESRRVFIYEGWKLHILEQTGTYRFFRLDDNGEKGESLETKYPSDFARVKDAYELFVATQFRPIPAVKYDSGPLTKMP